MVKRNKRKKTIFENNLYNDYYNYGYINSTLNSKISSQEVHSIAEEIFGNKYYVTVNDLNSEK